MTFIITLIALVMERFFHWSHLRRWHWFARYQQWLGGRMGSGSSYLLLAMCVLPPVLMVGLVGRLLSGWWYGAFELLFGVLVLLYCLGTENVWAQSYACMSDLHKDDPKIAIDHVNTAFGTGVPENSQAFHQAFVRSIFLAAYQRVFAVMFWFVLLGPMGAVLYRMVALCSAESSLGLTSVATQVERILTWVPVRILTVFFALGGHFTEVFAQWKLNALKGLASSDTLLTECGVAALAITKNGLQLPEDGSAEKAALALVDRAFIIGLVILAFVVLMV